MYVSETSVSVQYNSFNRLKRFVDEGVHLFYCHRRSMLTTEEKGIN